MGLHPVHKDVEVTENSKDPTLCRVRTCPCLISNLARIKSRILVSLKLSFWPIFNMPLKSTVPI